MKKQLIKYFLFKIILEVIKIFGLFKIYILSSTKVGFSSKEEKNHSSFKQKKIWE